MRIFEKRLTKAQRRHLNELADGIECGALLLPEQAYAELVTWDQHPEIGQLKPVKACVLGAAWCCHLVKTGQEITPANTVADYGKILDAYGVKDFETARTFAAPITYSEIGAVYTFYPAIQFSNVLWQLNDRARWTREQIAAWLRTLA